MSAEAYAALLEQAGHRLVQTSSAWWYDAHPHWFQSIPFHQELAPTSAELRQVFGQGAWVIRYSCPVPAGTPSYRSTCDDASYGLSSLSATARRATRRGLERCTVREMSFSELEPLGGLELSRSTLVRQHRKVPSDHDRYWRRHYAEAERSDAATCWGAFTGGHLAAFMIAIRIEDCVYLPVLKSSTDHLSAYPNNALVFTVTRQALDLPGVTEVSWGLESLLPSLEGLERFKLGMGFEHRAIGQRIEMTPWLHAGVTGPVTWAVEQIAARGGGRHSVDRAATTLRWHASQPARST